jgi:tetratricopeptide (TPR) repeat protein
MLICLLALLGVPGLGSGSELQYSSKEFAKLDTFEAAAVEDADKLFGKKDYRGALAAYKAYTTEFHRGRALPYVLFRMGRCLHLAGKRNTAIKAYQDVVDYFPDDVPYAAAALYYIGQCHEQNGNQDKALATWAKLAKDKDYVMEPRSGGALVALSTAMDKRGDHEEATRFRWRAAVAFAKSNPDAAREARDSVVYHYVVRSPNQEKLLAFCKDVGDFGWRRRLDQPQDSPTYWKHVLDVAMRAGVSDEKRLDVCRYWDAQMGDRFVDNDPLRVTWFGVRLAHDKDAANWSKRMAEQFKRQPVSIGRVKQWLGYYNHFPKLRAAFFEEFGKPLVAGLDTKAKMDLMHHLRHRVRMDAEARDVMRSVRTNDMDDGTLRSFAYFAADYEGEETFLRIVGKMKDSLYAARTRFDWYYARAHRNGDYQKKALAEVPALKNSTDHAQDIVWKHATLMQWQGEYEQAIKLYQAANRQPQSTWAIIDCRIALKQYDKAIALTRELESVGGGVASAACLKAADIYRIAGNKGKEVQQLQLVLRRYPKSGQSSTAHERLESYGVKLIGGEAVAEE